jgi:hypothetical protein
MFLTEPTAVLAQSFLFKNSRYFTSYSNYMSSCLIIEVLTQYVWGRGEKPPGFGGETRGKETTLKTWA